MSNKSPSSAAIDELIDLALRSDRESEEYSGAVLELQARGDRVTFEKARALSLGAGEPERILGIDVLAQLGFREGRPFLEESLPLVESLAGPGQSAHMLDAAIAALGHLGDKRSLPVVLAHSRHPDPEVRFTVAVALPSVCGDPPPRAALEAFISLMDDAEPEVRNWATFGLGSQLDVDTPEVRDALFARVEDDEAAEGDIAGEALRGLARRKDERALTPILCWLAIRDPDPGDLIIEAAEELADARCLPALYALREVWDEDGRGGALAAAIEACESGQPSDSCAQE